MMIKPLGFMHKAAAGGGPTRRKLVSTSAAANTGMHSTSTIATTNDEGTIAFWYQHKASNIGNTIWASDGGQYQIYIADLGAGANGLVVRRYNNDAAKSTVTFVVDTWYHIHFQFGINFDGAIDVRLYVDGTEEDTNVSGNSGGEIDSAGTHWLLGDDPPSGTTTDDGYEGEIFDFAFFDGIVAIGDSNYSTGSWTDFSAGALSSLLYRIDGQNASDPGEDSSGNGHDFTVESSGVTLSATDLPSGANP